MIYSGFDITHDGLSANKRIVTHSHPLIPRDLHQTELMVLNKGNKDVSNVCVIPVVKAPFSMMKKRHGSYSIHMEALDISWHIRPPLTFQDVHRGMAASKRVSFWRHEDFCIGAVCLFDQKGQRFDHFPIIQDFTFPTDYLKQLFTLRPQPRPAVPEADLEALECNTKLPFRPRGAQSSGQSLSCAL